MFDAPVVRARVKVSEHVPQTDIEHAIGILDTDKFRRRQRQSFSPASRIPLITFRGFEHDIAPQLADFCPVSTHFREALFLQVDQKLCLSLASRPVAIPHLKKKVLKQMERRIREF